MIHVFGIGLVIFLVLAGTLLPFLPGEYDPGAVPFSITLQFVAFPALLLVPVGVLAAAWRRSGLAAARARVLAGLAITAGAVVWLAGLLATFMFSRVLSVFVAGLGVYFFVLVVRRWRQAAAFVAGPSAAYFIVVPIAVIVLQFATIPAAIERSRSRAIRNSQALIDDIERYYRTNGRFPPSLLAMHPDYKPMVMGIEKYQYEPSGESYNVFFEQLAYQFGTQEIVMYNPRDEQQATGHAMDLLQYSPELLNRARGYYAVRDAAHPHWKLFWFD